MSSQRERAVMLKHWLTQRKLTERESDEARATLDRWYKRARLALDKGDVELARVAKDNAAQAAEAVRRHSAQLDQIDLELMALRSEAWKPSSDAFDAAQERVRHAAEQFAALGIGESELMAPPGAVAPAGATSGADPFATDALAPPGGTAATAAPSSAHEQTADEALAEALREADALLEEADREARAAAGSANPDPATKP